MLTSNENYIKYVTEDIKNHKGLFHPVKSSIISRIRTKNIAPKKLHPNPEDEFSMESVGPNFEIIGNYEKEILLRQSNDLSPFEEPLIAVKLDKGGYMLLNGHHRWMAAINVKIKKVPVQIVNITHEDDVARVINKSERTKCVTIDLDEVLLSYNTPAPFPFNLIYKNNLRENVSLIIREFTRLGYDIWIYTGSYMSEQYIKGLFSINKCNIDGIVNGINGKRNSAKLKNTFREKYDYILHVDREMLICVNTKTKDYETVDIATNESEWAASVTSNIAKLSMHN